MHGIAKRGLALVAATSGIVFGGAAIASADASTTATTTQSGGVVAGWAVQAPANVPVNVCGNTVQAIAFHELVKGDVCKNYQGASATATTTKSGGIGSGNTVQAVANVPVNVCGNTVVGAGIKNYYDGSKCTNKGQGAWASSTTTQSGGIASGNTVQAVLNVPVNVCGNTVGLGVVKNYYGGSSCSN